MIGVAPRKRASCKAEKVDAAARAVHKHRLPSGAPGGGERAPSGEVRRAQRCARGERHVRRQRHGVGLGDEAVGEAYVPVTLPASQTRAPAATRVTPAHSLDRARAALPGVHGQRRQLRVISAPLVRFHGGRHPTSATRTWPGPGTSAGILRTIKFSGGPNESRTIAFIAIGWCASTRRAAGAARSAARNTAWSAARWKVLACKSAPKVGARARSTVASRTTATRLLYKCVNSCW